MYSNLWLIPLFPLVGFLINGLFGSRLKQEKVVGGIGTLAIFASFVVSSLCFFQLLGDKVKEHEVVYASWMEVGQLQVDWGFLLDPLSALMIMVVSGLSFLIHLYSIGYMHGDPGYARFFAYLNLFTLAMLMLVLGNNALVMFIGWEGVGLCSYLLIGYFYDKQSASDAGKKAFVVNRIGDFGFLVGLFTLFWSLGSHGVWTLNFTEITANAHLLGTGGIVTVITLCFFLGATGKSAQIPLYTWLPDAMEGPTPVSALIHAATMVTAGVYMIGRMNMLYAQSPDAMMVVAIVGAATAIFAASIGLAQNDIKRVLAYSTVSQLGYMFLAMGVGAFSTGIFHLMTHAFFKACLFLGSGSVIHAVHHALEHEGYHDDPQDMRNMGGVRKYMPHTYWTFLVSTLAISGIPIFSGFFSKDEILWWAFASSHGHVALWAIGAVAAGMTAFYMFRLVFMTFFGPQKTRGEAKKHIHESPLVMTLPLMILGIGATLGGLIGIPAVLIKGANKIHEFLAPVFHQAQKAHHIHVDHSLGAPVELPMMGLSIGIAVFGIALAYYMYLKRPEMPGRFVANFQGLYQLIFRKWYVDEIYDALFVNPTKRLGTLLWKGFDVIIIDGIVNGVAWLAQGTSRLLRYTQTGLTHHYALVMVAGTVVILAFYLFD